MTTTPLFDTIARRTDRPAAAPAAAAPVAPLAPSLARATFTPTAQAMPQELAAVVADLPARMTAAAEQEFRISEEQRALVEALGDSFIRVVVDSLATELERIVRDRVVRS